jgi:hypothetical protein
MVVDPEGALRERFIDKAGDRLLKSFSPRLGCIRYRAEAQAIVTEWLGQTARSRPSAS